MKAARRVKYLFLGLAVAFAIVFQVATIFRALAQEDTAFPAPATSGNRPTVEARFVPDSVAIGDRFELEVTIEKDMVQVVELPHYENNLMGGFIEILGESPLDTLERDGRRLKLRKRFMLTTFEDGDFPLGHYQVLYLDKNIVDTIDSREPLHLQVGTFEIDTLTMQIYDIKPTLAAPLHPMEFIGYIGIWLVVKAILAAVAIGLVLRRHKEEKTPVRRRSLEPPHVAAIKALEILHNQKMWQNSKHKLYYTRLTDILREYLEGRYDINAMEMTTEEIMGAASGCGLSYKNYMELKDVLSTADLVKFAKFVPDADYNEQAYTNAYYFVEDTKATEVEEKPTDDEDKPIEDLAL